MHMIMNMLAVSGSCDRQFKVYLVIRSNITHEVPNYITCWWMAQTFTISKGGLTVSRCVKQTLHSDCHDECRPPLVVGMGGVRFHQI